MPNNDTILKIENLKVNFSQNNRILKRKNIENTNAVNGVNLLLKKGDSLGIAGESGCGKSTLAKTILRLINPAEGKVFFKNNDITNLPEKKLKKYRTQFQVIFQDPYASLNPRMTVYNILAEPLLEHKIIPKQKIRNKITELMSLVGLSSNLAEKYPHEFSGGQRQRVAIARALSVNPELLIADEPVSALDVSIQAQILNLIKDIQQNLNFTLLFISHNLAVIRYICSRTAVMYAGKILEEGNTDSIFFNPKHPYTKSLLKAVPVLPEDFNDHKQCFGKYEEIDIKAPKKLSSGCVYYHRCTKQKTSDCSILQPLLAPASKSSNHLVACHNP